MKLYQGFSLIELMIVVAIVGILAMIAVPSYQQYAKRARFVEVISATEPFKLAVTLALQEGFSADTLSNNSHGIPTSPPATKNLTSIEVKNGIITATGSELVNQATYILKPDANNGTWRVEGTCIKMGLCGV